MYPGMRRLKQFFKNAFTLILSTLILFIVLEGVLRLMGVKPQIAWVNPEGPFATDADTIWALKGNYAGTWSGVDFRTNGFGFRDDSFTRAKEADVFRIFILGGSTATGYGLERPYPYPDQLEQLLGSTSSRHLEVINAGIPGFSTTQNTAFLKQKVLALSPDFIILDFAINDILDKKLTLENQHEFRGGGAFLKFNQTPTATDFSSMAQEYARELPRYTALFTGANFLRNKLLYKRLLKQEHDRGRILMDALLAGRMDAFLTSAWEDTQKDLLEFIALCRQNHITVWVMTFPVKQQVEKTTGLDFPQSEIARFLKQQDVPFIDLLPVFRKRLQEGLLIDVLYLDDEHPAAPGHNAAAAALQEHMIENINLFLPRQSPTEKGEAPTQNEEGQRE